MSKWKAAVYLRLSSDDGDKAESNSITNQKKLIKMFISKEKNIEVFDYYIDDGYSGTDFNRPDFGRLLKDMKNEKINTVIVKDLSRLGRNYIEVGHYIEEFFPLYNIRFIAINDNVDSFKDPKSTTNIIVPFKNLMNDEYARDISNKVRSVLNTKRLNGEFIGMSAPYGYLKDPKDKHKFIVDKTASKVVKKIFEMALNGKSKKQITEYLNKNNIEPPALYKINSSIAKCKKGKDMDIWKTRTIDKILQNQSYIGDLVQGRYKRVSHKIHKIVKINKENWIIVPNHHQALVSKEDFNEVQNLIYSRDKRVGNNNEYDIFSGHLKCADCGNTLTKKKANGIEYYYCSSYARKKECTKHSTSKKKLEDIVLKTLNAQIEMLFDIDNKIKEITNSDNVNYDYEILKNRIEQINNNIIKYEQVEKDLKEDYMSEIISKEEYQEYKVEYKDMLHKLRESKKQLEKNIDDVKNKTNQKNEWIDKFIKNRNLNKLSKQIIDKLIEYINIYENGDIKIDFKYQDEYIEAINFINIYNI